jgi:anti-anti-sigma factor
MTEPLAQVHTDREPSGRVVVTIVGEIDLSNADDVRQDAAEALRHGGSLVVDLSSVRYMDSQAVKILADLATATPDGSLTIVAPRGSIAGELLAMTSLDRIVEVRESAEDT